jgi:hypothetical protein
MQPAQSSLHMVKITSRQKTIQENPLLDLSIAEKKKNLWEQNVHNKPDL